MLGHIIYNATCYLPYAFVLFLTVLIFPALSFFPSLIRKPVLLTSIPIISILLVNLIAVCLYKFNYFHRPEILGVTAVFIVVGACRLLFYCRSHVLEWEKNDKYIFFINMAILLPLIAFNGLSSFMTNDALASWNYWALLYSEGAVPDTMGYPPFFSFLIAYCYKILGNSEYQGPVKTLFVAFPFCVLNAIAFANSKVKEHIFLYLLLISVCVFPGFLTFKIYRFYSVGYADPLLAAAVVVSMLLILQYLQNPIQKECLLLGVLCSVTASLSKQPGLLWACVSMPLLLVFKMVYLREVNKSEIVAIILLFIPASIWLFGPGSHFYHNPGVLKASMHHEHFDVYAALLTLKFSLQKYFILQPSLLLLFLFSYFAARRNVYKLCIWFVFLLPGYLLWFVFGSYGMRLGLYLLGCSGLLIASENFLLSNKMQHLSLHFSRFLSLKKILQCCVAINSLLFATFSYTDQVNKHINEPYQVYPLNAGLTNLHHYFGAQADFIYQNIYTHPQIKIWAPHRLTAGLFYTHTQIIPASANMNNPDLIYAELKKYKPDYVFIPFCDRRDYFDCEGILKFVKKYPEVLIPIPLEDKGYGYRLYRLA